MKRKESAIIPFSIDYIPLVSYSRVCLLNSIYAYKHKLKSQAFKGKKNKELLLSQINTL